jgi:hypothetical protein
MCERVRKETAASTLSKSCTSFSNGCRCPKSRASHETNVKLKTGTRNASRAKRMRGQTTFAVVDWSSPSHDSPAAARP